MFSAAVIIMFGMTASMTQCSENAGFADTADPDEEVLKQTGQDPLSDQEIKGILFMREEEKLARDVYLDLYEVYPLRPFLNISKSEQAHMDAVLYLIEVYGLEDPVGENPRGVFQNEGLQQMYKELIQAGSATREEALKVGALIEEVDILDLQHELENNVTNDDVRRVFANLCRASEYHLRAFVRVLRFYGVEYEPVKLSMEEFTRIMEQ